MHSALYLLGGLARPNWGDVHLCLLHRGNMRITSQVQYKSTVNYIGCIGMHFLCWWAFCHNPLIFSYQGFLFWRHFGIFSWTKSCQTYLQQGHSPFDRRWTAPESRFWVGGARECRGLSDKLSPGQPVAASDVPITWHSSQPGN